MLLSLCRRAIYVIISMPEGNLCYYLYAGGQFRLSSRRRAIYYPGLIFHLAGGQFIIVEVEASNILHS